MKLLPAITLVFLALISVECKDLVVGTSFQNRLIWQQSVEYNAIPLKKRVKEVFFSDPGQQIIKAIIARDIDQSEALPTITAGGIGFSYANLRFKSGRGSGLNYRVEIYI